MAVNKHLTGIPIFNNGCVAFKIVISSAIEGNLILRHCEASS